MFDSAIFEDYGYGLQNAIWERQKEIVETAYDLWIDSGDEIFDGYYRWFFPAGFIDRDRERAKKVIKNIRNIVHSPVIRHDPEAIYCYVMYHMIEAWFDDKLYQGVDLLPEDVKEYIAGLEIKKLDADEDEAENLADEIDAIREWFTVKEVCQFDFESVYDGDYVNESMAETMAEEFLQGTPYLDYLGVEIRELIDLLPDDLYEKVVAKLGGGETSLAHQIMIACEMLSNNALDYSGFGENAINRRVRDYLKGTLKEYEVLDQTHQGFGKNKKEEGSIDILIKKDGLNEAIYEGLIHKDFRYLTEHIAKAIERYNPSGCRKVYVGEYYKNNRFGVCWKNTVKNLNQSYSGSEVDTNRNGLCAYQFNIGNLTGKTTVLVVGVNMGVPKR